VTPHRQNTYVNDTQIGHVVLLSMAFALKCDRLFFN